MRTPRWQQQLLASKAILSAQLYEAGMAKGRHASTMRLLQQHRSRSLQQLPVG